MDANASGRAAARTTAWADPATLSDADLAVLHDRIDFVRGGVSSEIFAAGDQLEALEQREREIAEQRRLLHEQIEVLRAERGRRRAVPSSR